ncbi:hypothetical protein HDV00_009170 [Rhizophlyctis rosea]|nr:hypothetical protein HDV00_009170 [Rhizophlyctis rosea]
MTGQRLQKRGAFIVFEGGDRSGKSTQSQRLVEELNAAGVPTQLRRFPDRTTPSGQLIDQYLKGNNDLNDHTVHLLFSANRWEAITEMRQTLESGTTLVVDRYAYSGVAYSAAKGLDLSWCKGPDVGLLIPDLVIYLDLSPSDAASRGDFGTERYEKVEFQEKVRAIFRNLADKQWKIIDANKSVDVLQNETREFVDQALDKVGSAPLLNGLWQHP